MKAYEGKDLSIRMGEFKPTPMTITFNNNGTDLGTLREQENGSLSFTGNADEAANVFFEHVCLKHSAFIRELKEKVANLEDELAKSNLCKQPA